MEIYLDKKFVQNYWSISATKKVLDAFENDFLRQLSKCTLICNYNSLEEIRANEEASVLFDLILESGTPEEIIYQPALTEEDNLTSCLSSGDVKLFFMELDEDDVLRLEKLYGYRIISTATLGEKWKYFLQYKQVERSLAEQVNPDDEYIFNGWEDLRFIKKFPSNSIVVVDKYILSDNKNNRMKNNLIPLLHQLIPDAYQGELSVIILSEEILRNQKNQHDIEKSKRVYGLLNQEFARYKSLKIRFAIISHRKVFYAKGQPEIHDRHIYTNYFTITSGPGFNLFGDKKTRKKINSDIRIEFNFRKYGLRSLPGRLDGLYRYFEKLKKTDDYKMFKSYPEKFNCPLVGLVG